MNTVNVPNINQFFLEGQWENLTQTVVFDDNKSLIELYESYHSLDDVKGKNTEETVANIRQTDFCYDYEVIQSFEPCSNVLHVLQHNPSDEELKLIYKNAPDVAILYDNVSTYYIARVGSGMDMSEVIAYAYMVIDSCVPVNFNVSQNLILEQNIYEDLTNFMDNQ